jgi:diguanylate cyclase (GGDEF)-like protein/PAS domain S-box-containing protein
LAKALRSMTARAASIDALTKDNDRAQAVLNSIGDAVLSVDIRGNVTDLNAVAEALTGWSRKEAAGHSFEKVLPIIDATTRACVPNPLTAAMLNNETVALQKNCIYVRRDGIEIAIEDTTAPIHDRAGQLTGAVMVFRDVSTVRAESQKLSHLAWHDGLTDLPNSTLFNDRLTQAMALAHRHGHKLAVIFIDIDRFKLVNDALGHVSGDRLLQSVAQRLLSCVRSTDTVSRRGGDEFVVLLSEVAQAEDAGVSAEKILAALAQPHCIGQSSVQVTASLGIATFPDDGAEAETLLSNADCAMYYAKGSGRSCYQFFKQLRTCAP